MNTNHIKRTLLFLLALFVFQVIFAQSQKFRGYPLKDPGSDLISNFKNPPKGYGNIPFYWWNGDSLDINRLNEQLDILSESAIDGFAVSYLHLDPKVDIEESKDGYGLFGKTESGKPEIFTDQWWNIWQSFSKSCAEKGIGLGLDDYTVGWKGNGYYPDELGEIPTFKNYKGELVFRKYDVEGGSYLNCDIPEDLIYIVAWPDNINLTTNVNNGKLSWKAPKGISQKVYLISTTNNYAIHPDHGKVLTQLYFDQFEKKIGDSAEDGLNYFFQDELSYPISIGTWSEDFREEFTKRKSYDITPFLPALIEYIGTITPKIRLDYSDVLMDLAEERYFKPIYDWHASRGLIYGSDNLSRGKDPLAYVDYFRANSWYTAPGNDAPSKGSSFISTKVSSSIAHINKRPRTWLEAFHSMGWGSSGEWLTQQTDHHFMAGGNLLCMHGLYYSTHGGWWEWAPPCFHFRMPYWDHMKNWLKYTERLSYIMSQGTHVCDIAIMYPTETMQAYPESNPDSTFDLALKLSNAGLDYDFLNYKALQESIIKDGTINISDEKYKIIIISDMQAMHHNSLLKILEHYRSGGVVLASGLLPNASSLTGEGNTEVDEIIKEIFGLTAEEAKLGRQNNITNNNSKGIGIHLSNDEMVNTIKNLITPDFVPEGGEGKVLHRKMGERDLFMVMDVAKNSECFFRAKGKVELWDASTGSISDFPIARQTEEGTYLLLEKESSNSYLIVFSPGTPSFNSKKKEYKVIDKIKIDNKWEVELRPTMNNKWGDFRFPASEEIISAEARTFIHQANYTSDKSWIQPGFDDSHWTEGIYGYGIQSSLHVIPSSIPLAKAVDSIKETNSFASDFEFSWQYGVWDNPGSQGWHGLKGQVSDGYFILDKGGHQIYETYLYTPNNGDYRIEIDGIRPDLLLINGQNSFSQVTLEKGWHKLIIAYANTKQTDYKPEKGALRDFRERSAVVFYPADIKTPNKNPRYAKTISTRWALGDHLMMDPYCHRNKQWNYRFLSVPGLKSMDFTIAGKIMQIWFDGDQIPGSNIHLIEESPTGIRKYKIYLKEEKKEIGTVAFSVEREIGYQGAAVICEPIKLTTGKGLLEVGDWSKTGSLKHYSGGMIYRNIINLNFKEGYSKLKLDLGNVVASCEIKVNGQDLGVFMSPPYEIDITEHAISGSNTIEVLVYSTLSNHYQTIPTPYRGDPIAGLIGPVSISILHPSK